VVSTTRAAYAIRSAVATLTLMLVVSCSDDAPGPSVGQHATESATAAASTLPADSLPGELQGTWLVDLTREQVREDLRSAGFGAYADDFFEAEGLGQHIILAVTYTASTFQIAWLNPDHTWYVGWYGAARQDAGVLTVTDAEGGGNDSYAWTVTDDQLTLRFRHTSGTEAKGIPFEAYSRAYFTRPLRAVDCTPADLYQCL
jgi:hypothetical protein